MHRFLVAAATALALLGAAVAVAPAAVATSVVQPIPNGDPTIAAVFVGSNARHTCSAAVVASPAHNLVMTAAHCINGSGTNMTFCPGWHDGQAPFGCWTASAAYADPSWVSAQDPQHDYAFLVLAPAGGTRIQDVVGANQLGPAVANGALTTVIAYNSTGTDEPMTCTQHVSYTTAGYPRFYCRGFLGGSSGGPFLVTSQKVRYVEGLIGGYQQGGCTTNVSYSSAFSADTTTLYQRATTGATPDVLPARNAVVC